MPRILSLLVAVMPLSRVLLGQNGPEGLRKLSKVRPKITWDRQSVVTADIACDHGLDQAYLGRSAHQVYVGFVRAANKKARFCNSAWGDHQDAICEEPAMLSVESMDYDLDARGFKRSRTCKGLVLSGGDCDPIHLFWNHATQNLDWWRN
jgi:hypothetical protein